MDKCAVKKVMEDPPEFEVRDEMVEPVAVG